MESEVQSTATATTKSEKPPGEESKQSKWKKLQRKYLQYIQLLKKKIEHAQKKSSAQHTKMTSISQMSVKHDPRLVAVLLLQIENYRRRQMCVGFHSIRAAAMVRGSLDRMLTSKQQRKTERKSAQWKVLALAKAVDKAIQCTYKHYFQKIESHAWPIATRLNGYVFDKLQQRMLSTKEQGFYRIMAQRYQGSNPIPNMRCSLQSIKSKLNFDSIVSNDIEMKWTVSRINRENLQLRAINLHLTEKISKLEHELLKEQEQRRLETDKKEKGLIELGEEMQQKQAFIQLLEAQLDNLRKTTHPELLNKIENKLEMEELRTQVDRLVDQLEKTQETSKQSLIKSRQTQSQLRQKIHHLTYELEKVQEAQYNISYSRKLLDEERQNIHSLKKIINRQEAELRPRQQRCSLIETTFSRIHQYIAVSQMQASEIIESEESARSTLQRIITLVNDKRLAAGNPLDVSHHSRTNLDLLTMVEQMLDRSRQFQYDQLLNFGGLCQDLYRLQQKINKLKKANTLVKQSILNGNDTGPRRRKWVKQQRDDWQASNIPESDPGNNLSNRQNHSNPQLTTRLIELEMEKKKCEELVLQLKQQHMMVRKIVHEFIKTLGLAAKQPPSLPRTLSKQTDYALGVLLEIFEYSEEEKDALFQSSKRRGFLGLF